MMYIYTADKLRNLVINGIGIEISNIEWGAIGEVGCNDRVDSRNMLKVINGHISTSL